MTTARSATALGAALTLEQLDLAPHATLARLREQNPVAWIPALGGWLVTRRDLCIEVMRDAVTYTVDDPRFSTGQVVGPSMLSLDGHQHRRHRDPFAKAFLGPDARSRSGGPIAALARGHVQKLRPAGAAEIRRDLAGPLAVDVVAGALDLPDVDPEVLLGWYAEIVTAVDRISAGEETDHPAEATMVELDRHVRAAIDVGVGVLSAATTTLDPAEIVSDAAVMMFGGIETGEGMTTTLFWHLLSDPVQFAAVLDDRTLLPDAVEESLRLEPAASRVDRYATADVVLAGTSIRRGDLVIVSLTAANRDPATFPDPDSFDLRRPNARSHVAFAQGPHACIGPHLARAQTQAALSAALDAWPNLRLETGATAPTGLIFRKPRSLPVRWSV